MRDLTSGEATRFPPNRPKQRLVTRGNYRNYDCRGGEIGMIAVNLFIKRRPQNKCHEADIKPTLCVYTAVCYTMGSKFSRVELFRSRLTGCEEMGFFMCLFRQYLPSDRRTNGILFRISSICFSHKRLNLKDRHSSCRRVQDVQRSRFGVHSVLLTGFFLNT